VSRAFDSNNRRAQGDETNGQTCYSGATRQANVWRIHLFDLVQQNRRDTGVVRQDREWRQQMTYFLCKMTLPRKDFVQTMTDSEKNIMKAHGDYLQSLAEVGSIVCHGPVDDPKGGWGLSIFSAKDQSEVEGLTAADPIILDDIGARYEILPMRQLRMKGSG
jgi:uncharacterized protein YciI